MLTLKEIRRVEELLDNLFGEFNAELIERIVRSVAHGKQMSDVNQWRIRKLAQYSEMSKELSSFIAHEAYKRQTRVEQAITSALDRSAENDFKRVKEAVKDGAELAKLSKVGKDSPLYKRYKEAILTNCRKQLNLTNTRAVQAGQKAWLDTVNKAYVKARTGFSSLDDAVQDCCHDLGGSGLFVDYISDSGKHSTYPLDASIRRDIITSLNQSTSEYTLATNKAMGNDLVKVSYLADSRTSHAPFQNNVYSISGKSKKYPPLSSTGYGTAGGLCGINCRHQLFPYFEDIEGRAKKETMTAEEKAEATRRYENSQRQRAYEVQIRQLKRQLIADKASGSKKYEAETQSKLTEKNKEFNEFLRQTNRHHSRGRERVE